MGKNIVIVAILVIAAYVVGVETAKRSRKDYEDVRHQLERLWQSPEARRSRKRLAKKAQRRLDDAVEGAQKIYRRVAE